jgi:hypothetical protein
MRAAFSCPRVTFRRVGSLGREKMQPSLQPTARHSPVPLAADPASQQAALCIRIPRMFHGHEGILLWGEGV